MLRQEYEHFVLSFVMNQKVYHVNVAQNEELDHLELGGVGISIKTIHDMIAHFKKLPFYNNVTLGTEASTGKQKSMTATKTKTTTTTITLTTTLK